MKNFVKNDQKMPIYGVGPYIIGALVMVTALGIAVFHYVLKIGIIGMPWSLTFYIVGGLLIVLGAFVWFIGAFRSDMDNEIANNKLKTDGIYAWVRNPMYSGLWMLIAGVSFMWHNAWLLILPFLNWIIMTIALKKTEERWLLDLYGEEYAKYKKKVNRCLPWKRKR